MLQYFILAHISEDIVDAAVGRPLQANRLDFDRTRGIILEMIPDLAAWILTICYQSKE